MGNRDDAHRESKTVSEAEEENLITEVRVGHDVVVLVVGDRHYEMTPGVAEQKGRDLIEAANIARLPRESINRLIEQQELLALMKPPSEKT